MSVIIRPEVSKAHEIPFHKDIALGKRFVFLKRRLYPQSQFYIIGRRVEDVTTDQPNYIDLHRHNRNSFYFFIGDENGLSGIEAEVDVEGNKFVVQSPSTVMIPQCCLHSYKLTKGKGWFFHVVPKPSYEESIISGNLGSSQQPQIKSSEIIKRFEPQSARPKTTDRPIGSGSAELINPRRYVLVDPKLFKKAGIYAALHQIFSGVPFGLNQQLHSNYEDEAYIFFSRSGEKVQVDIFSSENEKVRVESPVTVYHHKGELHKYDYVSGSGFMFVVLKEKFSGDGYSYIPLNKN